jgi:hypothetical protein
VARSRSGHDRTPPLSDLDLHILDLLSSHRVMTQNQLAEVNPRTPARTLRYRSNRLAKLGLAGRSRPYRERGSAPHHLWPTRKGEAIVTGGPPPRGGERREPNPLFLAHAAGLSQIYVALETTLPAGLALRRFEREGEAREEFGEQREKRAIAPDIFFEVTDERGRGLLAFVELDMGTMSHRQLKKKAEGYAAYADLEAWRDRHRYPPVLLFATTTEKRARAFLAAMHRTEKPHRWSLTAASDLGRGLRRIAVEPRWLIEDEDAGPMDLVEVLREARRPYDEAQAARRAQRQEEDEERHRLRTDPEALRAHLRSWGHVSWGLGRLEGSEAVALRLTMDSDVPLAPVERDVLLTLGAYLEDPLHPGFSGGGRAGQEMPGFARLLQHHREAQLDHIDRLQAKRGAGPSLRLARQAIKEGAVLDARALPDLAMDVSHDQNAREQQEGLRDDYLGWREEEARRLAKAQGIAGRLRNGPEVFLDQVDRRSLRRCRRCEEIAYPDPKRAEYERGVHPSIAFRCHFCDSRDLVEIDKADQERSRDQ